MYFLEVEIPLIACNIDQDFPIPAHIKMIDIGSTRYVHFTFTGTPPLTQFFGTQKNHVKGKSCYRRTK